MSQKAVDAAVRYVWLKRMVANLRDVEADIEVGAEDEAGEFLRIAADHVSAARQALWPEYLAARKDFEGVPGDRRVIPPPKPW